MELTARILAGRPATLTHTFRTGEAPVDADGPVTATVRRLDGVLVATGTAALIGAGTGRYQFALTGQPLPDGLTVDWAATVTGTARTERDLVEVVGGFLFDIAEARSEHTPGAVGAGNLALANTTAYPTELLERKRIQVEVECEGICRQAWVPRFARYLLDGSGSDELIVPDLAVRSVRAASIGVRAGAPLVPLSVDQLAAVAALPSGVLARDDGAVWPRGRRNVLVEYEHGADLPPVDVREAAILRLRSVVSQTRSGIPDRAVSFTVQDGGVYRIAAPGARSTGVPDVDAAYLRHAHEQVWIA